MRVEIEVSAKSAGWPTPPTELESFTQQVLAAAAAQLPVTLPLESEVSVVFSEDRAVRALNQQYRDKNTPTNVLSFPLLDTAHQLQAAVQNPAGPPLLLGDIILADGVVSDEAKKAGLPIHDHIAHLLVHGFLHLLGYDHIDDRDAERMQSLETRILADLKIADPYSQNAIDVRSRHHAIDSQEHPSS